jgi:hypothetical protein
VVINLKSTDRLWILSWKHLDLACKIYEHFLGEEIDPQKGT